MIRITTRSNIKRGLISLFFLIFLCQIVYSAPPFIELSQSQTLQIKYPELFYFKNSGDLKFNFHLYNITSGMPIKSDAICYFHLYNSSGNHIWENSTIKVDHIYDYEFLVSRKNISTPGFYSYLVQCNTSSIGGFVDVGFEVSNDGMEPNLYERGILKTVPLFFSALLFLIGLYLMYLMHKYKEDNISPAYGFIGGTIFIILGSVLLFGLKIIDSSLVTLPFDINKSIGLLCLVIGLFMMWISSVLWRAFRKSIIKEVDNEY